MKRHTMIPGIAAGALRTVTAALVLGIAAGVPLPAQSVATVQQASREALSARLAEVEQVLTLAANNRKAPVAAQAEAAQLRQRLADGDFQVGDRFLLTLVWDSIVTDTAQVREGLVVAIRSLPDVSVRGVLRAELERHLNAHVGQYLRNATVRTAALTRVSVVGTVLRPGFYHAAPNRPLSELVMVAGGPTELSNLNELEVRRNGRTILGAKESRRAIRSGRTLEEMDIRSGDEVRIPQKRKIPWQGILQLGFIASSLLFTYIQVLQIYAQNDR